ncbi:uncharacterized protein N7483_004763 [Penicillium malachiteum]|uniref:uncharacterized protein n=1 Tax=Penicillium malachiteum TaxID=1324776 RepID=UPI002548DCEF|nr:uncharacterized protein N7483_004763 [Penicillium malachiteum]KAJ5730255.1 hypothetical protein N7483_004763 [Penicillium malachiteum]
MSGEDVQPLVLDTGSFRTKAGFSGDDAPRALPTVIGNSHMGDEAISNGEPLINLIQNGTVTDWDALFKIYHYAFYKGLNVATEEHPILLAESPFTSQADREKVVKLMFETFNVPALNIVPDAVLAAYASQRVTALVVNVGTESAQIVPIIEGKCQAQAACQVSLNDVSVGIENVLQNFDSSTQSSLYNSVVLDGSSQSPGLADHVHNEIFRVVPESASVNVIQPANPGYAVWLGGTVLASQEGAIEQFTCSGGLYRIETKYLNAALHDSTLAANVEDYTTRFAFTPSTGGTTIDADGNIYVSDTQTLSIWKVTLDGYTSIILQDDRLLWTDLMWIIADKKLWMPASQMRSGGDGLMAAGPNYIFTYPIDAGPSPIDHA